MPLSVLFSILIAFHILLTYNVHKKYAHANCADLSGGVCPMAEYICFKKVRTENEIMEVHVSAQNPVISASAKIYVNAAILEELQEQIYAFLREQDLAAYWENDVPGIGGPPCVTLKLLPQDRSGHVLAEIYMELNDGGSFMEHNCRFYVSADRLQLKTFAQGIPQFCRDGNDCCLVLGQMQN